MALIDTSYFSADLNIAQKDQATVSSSLQWFIDKLEPKLLDDLLGYELSRNYQTGIAAGSPDQKWKDIRDGKEFTTRSGLLTKWRGLKFADGTSKKSPIANFIYFHWLKDQATITTGTGEKVDNSPNAIVASAGMKMVRAWNEMVDWNRMLIEFLLKNETTYPEFLNHYSLFVPNYLLAKINTLGI